AMEGKHGPAALAPYKADPLMTGLLSWTAHAYYTFHPSYSKANDKRDRTRSGAMTIFRYPRPALEWYKSELLPQPMVYIQDAWTPETKDVTVFSNAESVELFLNGRSIARSGINTDTIYRGLDHPPFHFNNVDYAPGELVAKAYFADGTEASCSRKTPGTPHALLLEVDTAGRQFVADGSDILMVYAQVVDENGTTVSGTDHQIRFTVEGDGSIVGDEAPIKANPMFTEYGVAPALVLAGTTTGPITIQAASAGLKGGSATVTLVPAQYDEVVKQAEPVYDFTRERVDLGAPDQLLQFSWRAWNGNDGEPATYQFTAFPGASATLRNGSEQGMIRWLGEMNVIGKYGFAYGDGTIAIDDAGVDLVLTGLPKGTYRLKTWHHAPSSNSDNMDPNREKLKTLTIHQLPYETEVVVSSPALLNGESVTVKTTSGKEMQWASPGVSELIFHADGVHPVVLNFNGKGNKGVWLNAFELSAWR
ncbi:MAG: DUF4982 domain-containing protein, partial [Bacteroidota bacterium]